MSKISKKMMDGYKRYCKDIGGRIISTSHPYTKAGVLSCNLGKTTIDLQQTTDEIFIFAPNVSITLINIHKITKIKGHIKEVYPHVKKKKPFGVLKLHTKDGNWAIVNESGKITVGSG